MDSMLLPFALLIFASTFQVSHTPKIELKIAKSTGFTGILKDFKIGKLLKKVYFIIKKNKKPFKNSSL